MVKLRSNGVLLKNLGASALGPVVTVAIQLAVIPIQLSFWGPNTFRDWVVLNAIPLLIALSDCGFSSAGATEMTIMVARKDQSAAALVFRAAFTLTLLVAAILAGGTLCLASSDWLRSTLRLNALSTDEILIVTCWTSLYAFFACMGSVVEGAYRAEGQFHRYHILNNVIRSLEGFAICVTVTCGGGIIVSAFVIASIRASGFLFTFRLARAFAPWVSVKPIVDLNILRHLRHPASGTLSITLANTLYLNGFLFVISYSASTGYIAVFSAMRTMTRLVNLAVTTVSSAVTPEITRSIGARDYIRRRQLVDRLFIFSATFGICAIACLAIVGAGAFEVWTRNSLAFDQVSFAWLLTAALFGALWSPQFAVLSAANEHYQSALISLPVAIAACICAVFLPTFTSESHLPACLAVADISIFLVTFLALRSPSTKGGDHKL